MKLFHEFLTLTNVIVPVRSAYLPNNALIISWFNAAPGNEIRESGPAPAELKDQIGFNSLSLAEVHSLRTPKTPRTCP
jgi:hypothetical protein